MPSRLWRRCPSGQSRPPPVPAQPGAALLALPADPVLHCPLPSRKPACCPCPHSQDWREATQAWQPSWLSVGRTQGEAARASQAALPAHAWGALLPKVLKGLLCTVVWEPGRTWHGGAKLSWKVLCRCRRCPRAVPLSFLSPGLDDRGGGRFIFPIPEHL